MTLLSSAQAAERIVMVFGDSYAPFYWNAESSNAATMQGMFIDFLTLFQKAHPEFSIERVTLPRKRMDAWMESGKAQAFSLTNPIFTPQQDRQLFFFTDTLWDNGAVIAVRREDAEELKHIDDLKGRTVAMIWGNGYHTFEKYIKNGNILPAYTHSYESMVHMLKKHRVDAMVVDKMTFSPLTRSAGFEPSDFVLFSNPLFSFPLSIQIRKDSPEFYNAMNSFIRECHNKHILQRLEQEYMTN